MAELTVDLTYGSALYSAAVELGKKDELLEEGLELVKLLEQEPELAAFLSDPVISAAEKKTVLTAVFDGKISREMMNLFFVLVDKGRAGHFSKIIKTYKDLADQEDGVSYGRIVSAVSLTEEQLARFEEETSKLFRMKVKLENETDRSLISGVKIFVNGRVIDTSLRKRLDDMAESFQM